MQVHFLIIDEWSPTLQEQAICKLSRHYRKVDVLVKNLRFSNLVFFKKRLETTEECWFPGWNRV